MFEEEAGDVRERRVSSILGNMMLMLLWGYVLGGYENISLG